MPGTLYVVATPIGNLEDLTFRALRVLREVDVIAAEDTRRTAKLLAHYEIRKTLVSLREHNEARETPRLLAQLASGRNIALVSDAGTPTIADPGTRLVRAGHEHKLPIVPIPGPSAIVTALSVSGFEGGEFVFLGFPPAGGAARTRWFKALAEEPRIAVFFEAPHRIERTLAELQTELGERQILVARELTKKFESVAIRPNCMAHGVESAGEFTVVVARKPFSEVDESQRSEQAADLVGRLTNSELIQYDEAVSIASLVMRSSPEKVRKIIKKRKISVDQQNRS